MENWIPQQWLILKEIADITGAKNFTAETIHEFRAVYEEIAYFLDKTAGRDLDTGDSNPMIRDVLPPNIQYIPGSFSKEPDHMYINESGYTIMEWNISSVFIGESWNVTFNITSSVLGFQEANNYSYSRISYINWEDLQIETLFPKTMVYVTIPKPKPPILSIEVVGEFDYLIGSGDSTRLTWIKPDSPNLAYYLIYRSTQQNNFDFRTPWIRTDVSYDNGILPLRTTWNDTSSNKPGDANYHQQMYYIIRAVNAEGVVSGTSRTVGKWTKEFPQGISTFSIPLKSIQTKNVGWYVLDMNADYIKWMNKNLNWQRYVPNKEGAPSPDVSLGEGYEIKFSNATTYTFSGLPSAMIRYDSYFGFDAQSANGEARSLDAKVDSCASVNLTWMQPQNMSRENRFYVLRSERPDGFWGVLNVNFELIANLPYNITNMQDFGSALEDTNYYYMIVPVNTSTGEWGGASYSIGVWTKGFNSGYDTIGLPLKLKSIFSVDWYCDNIKDTLGINYHLFSEQRWVWHKRIMPGGVYDTDIVMANGYQISTLNATRFSFVGI
jgi:hypothetical protein